MLWEIVRGIFHFVMYNHVSMNVKIIRLIDEPAEIYKAKSIKNNKTSIKY